MDAATINRLASDYRRDGVVSTPIIDAAEAGRHRSAMEEAERILGPMHYVDKVHTVVNSAYELATLPVVLDLVEAMLGPNILLYNVTYIIKEPGTDLFVAWHQDLTYWGLADEDAQVSMWLALAPATAESGCMTMVPGSHHRGRVEHSENPSDNNLLLRGQRIESVDLEQARPYPLAPGEASFHHGWTIHTSGPNTSDDRRIGLNVQYLAPHNHHRNADSTAILVRGRDDHGFFGSDKLPAANLDPEAISRWRALDRAMKDSFTSG
jgi:ectoine hydroxylase-related dioxygenase (phytanoyl-CoA dioxygenase family)